MQSSNLATGQDTGHVKYIKQRTTGLSVPAIWSCLGPIQIDYGTISPAITTATTEIRTAYAEGTTPSRNRGSASNASALDKRRVTNNQW